MTRPLRSVPIHGQRATIVALALVLGLFISTPLYAQLHVRAPNAVYVEFVGNSGPGLSINYERTVWGPLGVRTGAAWLPGFIDTQGRLGIPVMANAVVGGAWHKVEVGAGAVVQVAVHSDDTQREAKTLLAGTLAYRFAPRNGGFFLKAAFTPVRFYEERSGREDYDWIPLGGLSIGYAF